MVAEQVVQPDAHRDTDGRCCQGRYALAERIESRMDGRRIERGRVRWAQSWISAG
jgi:hypothetical protein